MIFFEYIGSPNYIFNSITWFASLIREGLLIAVVLRSTLQGKRYGHYGFGCSTFQEPKLSRGEALVGMTRTRGTVQRYAYMASCLRVIAANVFDLPSSPHHPTETFFFWREASGKRRLSGVHFNLLGVSNGHSCTMMSPTISLIAIRARWRSSRRGWEHRM